MKKKLRSGILEILAVDSDESVRMQVARHRNTPSEFLENLLQDEWNPVSECARDRLREVEVGSRKVRVARAGLHDVADALLEAAEKFPPNLPKLDDGVSMIFGALSMV